MIFGLIGQGLGSVWAASEAAETARVLVRHDLELQRKFQVIRQQLAGLQAAAKAAHPHDRAAEMRLVARGWAAVPQVAQLYGPTGVVGRMPSADGVARKVEVGGVVVNAGGTHESAIRSLLATNPRVDQDLIAWILVDACLWWPQ